MSLIRVLISRSHDPFFNLAVEETIFRSMPTDQRILFLWRNAETVVIGKGQNPWKECNTAKMEDDGIKLARRQTGGGAVFHDLGNTNFTFMAGKPEYNKEISTQIVLNGLRNCGVEGRATGRNDLVIDTPEGEKKFSGSAYRDAKDRGFHHGTLLLHADLSRLANYLNPDAKKLKAKGVTSVVSRVANLCELNQDINHERVCQAIQESFFAHYKEQVAPEFIEPETTPDLPGFQAAFRKQSDWNWNFGKAMDFTHHLEERFTWGGVELQLEVHQGEIKQAKIFTDSLYPGMLESVAQVITGQRYSPEISEKITKISEQYPAQENELIELQNWLAKAIK